jgi:hypothetical protein
MGHRGDLYSIVDNAIRNSMSSYGASTSTITLYGGFPDLKSITFPAIIIEPIELMEIGSSKTIDTVRDVSSKTMPVIVHIFAKRNRDLDIIADGINALNLSTSGFLLNDTSDSNAFLQANEQKVKGRTLTLTFLQR